MGNGRAICCACSRQLMALRVIFLATPMSFKSSSRRQIVVIAAGGSILLKSPIGDALVAFSLPRQ
jgi:glucose dehydrogenase